MSKYYTNISSPTTVTLINKGKSETIGNIQKITIANQATATNSTVKLFLDDGTNNYIITKTVIPPQVTLVLEDNLSFDVNIYNLKITTDSVADITIIIS
tara:strand:+ start:148 stop:444 length:297 start_codon:yes stop_codon:yes gene_type:complete